MMKRRLSIHLLTGMTLVCLYAISYNALLQQHNDTRLPNHSSAGQWNLPPTILLAVAGEFKGMVANYLTLEVGAQLGTELARKPDGGYRAVKKEHDWAGIYRLFMASLTLDPSFAQTYIVAQGWLPWEPAKMVTETQEILKIAAKNRLWDWRPIHARGFNTYYFLQQPGEAGKLFLEAAKRPYAPPFLPILGARLAQKGGETETAMVIIKSTLAAKSPEEPGYTDIIDRLHALEGVLVIEKAVDKYKKVMNHKPSSLSVLITSGILKALPPNPYNLDYCIDMQGAIYFDQPDCQKSVK